MFEITEEAAFDPMPSRAGSPYGSLLRWAGTLGWACRLRQCWGSAYLMPARLPACLTACLTDCLPS